LATYISDQYEAIPHKEAVFQNRVRVKAGMGINPHIIRGQVRKAYFAKLTPNTLEELRAIAVQAGLMLDGKGNTTALLEAIGQGLLILMPNPILFDKEVGGYAES